MLVQDDVDDVLLGQQVSLSWPTSVVETPDWPAHLAGQPFLFNFNFSRVPPWTTALLVTAIAGALVLVSASLAMAAADATVHVGTSASAAATCRHATAQGAAQSRVGLAWW